MRNACLVGGVSFHVLHDNFTAVVISNCSIQPHRTKEIKLARAPPQKTSSTRPLPPIYISTSEIFRFAATYFRLSQRRPDQSSCLPPNSWAVLPLPASNGRQHFSRISITFREGRKPGGAPRDRKPLAGATAENDGTMRGRFLCLPPAATWSRKSAHTN